MSKYLLFAALILISFNAFAENIRTDVLVIGGTYSGVAAATQCARSQVKTLLITPQATLGAAMAANQATIISQNSSLQAGFWGDFRKRVQAQFKSKKSADTAYAAPLQLTPAIFTSVVKQMTDTVKKLTIQFNTQWVSIKKEGSGWDVTITNNGKTEIIKTQVVVDATETGEVAIKAGAIFITDADHLDSTGRQLQGLTHLSLNNVYAPYSSDKVYRTAIAVCDGFVSTGKSLPAFSVPIGALVAKDADNLVVTGPVIAADYSINRSLANPSAQLMLGQGAGIIAAYCAFYETTTRQLNARAIQGELLGFKGYLLPFTDVRATDSDMRAIQQVGTTGLLQGKFKDRALCFMPDSVVNTDEIKPVLLETYTRAFLWFNKNNPLIEFTVGNLLSLISELTLQEPKPLEIKLQKQWKTTYHFNSDFDLQHTISRREFAVLVNQYLNPFARRIALDGRMMN